jgi:hypothetical protein
MFELIGLILATGFLFALAAAASATLAGSVWLILRRSARPYKLLMLAAVLIPIASAAYLWLCVALLPGESLFGDIDQPLPNGYAIQALGKMPDFAHISSPKTPYSDNGLTECIGKIAVYGPFVVGQYSHPFGDFTAKPNEPFFLFDTRSGQNQDLPTLDSLQDRLGHRVQLTEVQYFRSQELSYRRQQRMNREIEFAPPIIAVVILIALVVRRWAQDRSRWPKIYT